MTMDRSGNEDYDDDDGDDDDEDDDDDDDDGDDDDEDRGDDDDDDGGDGACDIDGTSTLVEFLLFFFVFPQPASSVMHLLGNLVRV